MKIKIICPRWPEGSIWRHFIFRFPYLSLTTLAALTPEDVEVTIEDENVQEINYQDQPDLVAVSIITPLANRGYAIADQFRKLSIPVVMGGVHATWMAEEAGQHADAVVLGEAEKVWPRVIADFRKGSYQRIYREESRPDLQNLPVPRRDLLKKRVYFFTNTMQISRGCPFQCDFCSVTAFFGHTCRLRPLKEVRKEVELLLKEKNFIFFMDDNIIANPAYARDLFSLLKEYRIKWLSHASVNIAENDDLLKKAGESGCYGLFIGFESLSQKTLQDHHKTTNRVDRYREFVKKIHDQGIGIEGSFIFGSDEEDPSVFQQVVDFCEETKIDAAVFAILTPYPGTRIYEQYTREERIISRNWDLYDMNHVVFRPKRMTIEQLQEGHDLANQRFYSYPSMLKRFWPLRRSHQVFLPSNWGMRRAWKFLAKSTLRG
ncbi:MAG: B12-binding domain-containing radical SAM protein [Deltaproteobacteria bacterium]|nr:B12-binding domain-containing radical SAM protein [Deltaproteobacteria bacterium]